MKILTTTKTSQAILVTDTYENITHEYPSARRAVEALNASNSTIINRLKAKNKKLYKGRYLTEGQFYYDSNMY